MKRKILDLVITIVIIIFISNIQPIRWIVFWPLDEDYFLFSNNSGDYYRINPNSAEFDGVEENFSTYIKESKNIPSEDTTLYRLFWRNPLTFWRYHNYLDPIYKLPYKNRNKIPRFKKHE